jgi:hypothetical protein
MAKIDERYKRGKIYTIRCKYDDELIYVGSTINTLAKRMGQHRGASIKKATCLYNVVCSDWDNWYIELYENYACNNKEELFKKEGEVIREISTINNKIAGRTPKEYKQDNREKIRERDKQYYQDNKEYFIKKSKEYRLANPNKIAEKTICNICSCEVTKYGLKKHKKTKKCKSVQS